MKKLYKIFVLCVVITCMVIAGYFAGVNLSKDDNIFELSVDEDIAHDEYYILKEDNTLMWAYGVGYLRNLTYSIFFDSVDEQGFAKVSDEDAKEMKMYMKRALKYYEPVPSNASIHVKDSSEFVLKHKNKYYNNNFPKEKYKYDDDYTTIYSVREKMKEYVEKYKEMGAYVYYE